MMAAEYRKDEKRGDGLEHDAAAGEFADDKPTGYSDGEETAAIAAEEGHVATDKSVLVSAIQSIYELTAHHRFQIRPPTSSLRPGCREKASDEDRLDDRSDRLSPVPVLLH
jgi:hypothetical protein